MECLSNVYNSDQNDQEGPLGSTVWFIKIFIVIHRVPLTFYNAREDFFFVGICDVQVGYFDFTQKRPSKQSHSIVSLRKTNAQDPKSHGMYCGGQCWAMLKD